MNRATPPPVAAEDVLVVVETYADRLHDLVRRRGVRSPAAAALVTSTALQLVDSAARRPPADLLGWWVHRLVDQTGGPAGAWTKGRREADRRLADALATLSPSHALAVRLRDDYDVPPGSLAVAGGADQHVTDTRVARARADLLAAAEGVVLDLRRHDGREPADAGTLGRYADGSLPAAEAKAVSRHVAGCRACEQYVEGQRRARRMLAALPVQAMGDDERAELLDRVATRARSLLPPLSEVLLVEEERAAEDAGRPLVSLPTVLAALAVAAVLGGITGAVTADNGPSARAAEEPGPVASTSATVSPGLLPSALPSATTATVRPTATRTASASPTPTPTPTQPTPTSSGVVPGSATLRIRPSSGPSDADISVSGTGWTPGSSVRITYLNQLGQEGSQAETVVDAAGSFATTIVAHDDLNLPGRHTVRATDGTTTRERTYTAQG